MGNILNVQDCCEKNISDVAEDRYQIFNFSPEDDQALDDSSILEPQNEAGGYPTDNDAIPAFIYQAKYPNLVNTDRIIINTIPQQKIIDDTEAKMEVQEEIQEQQNLLSMKIAKNRRDQLDFLMRLYSICNQNGTAPSISDFKYDGYKYINYIPPSNLLYEPNCQIFPNQIRIFNPKDPRNFQIYEGDINNLGQKHGKGKCTTIYYVRIGNWRDDKFTGWGRECRRNGDVFEGVFINGVLNGKGIFYNNNTNEKYIGDFVNYQRHGNGQLTTNKIIYQGQFLNNLFEGKGKLIYLKEGEEYNGQFHLGEMNGYGMFKWRTGDTYVGNVVKGKMHGTGTFYHRDGRVDTGKFIRGRKEEDFYRSVNNFAFGGGKYGSLLRSSVFSNDVGGSRIGIANSAVNGQPGIGLNNTVAGSNVGNSVVAPVSNSVNEVTPVNA